MTENAAHLRLRDNALATRAWEAPALMGIFLASGFAALVYQVLWVRELGLLFGSTAQAAAIAIAIFFSGIAAGGWFWGRRAPRMKSALAGFGALELGVAATALGHFLLIDAYHAVYPLLYAAAGHHGTLETLVKALVAFTVLFPPAFLMGGTLPLMGQHLIRERSRLGATGSALYAVNTFGGALGVLAAGFVLPMVLGLSGTYLLAVGTDLLVGLAALTLARSGASGPAPRQERPAVPPAAAPAPPADLALPHRMVWLVAFVSGAATLGVEIVWTRLFSQVLQNSAYTYSLVLATFLAALALGATVANTLCRTRIAPPAVMLCALLALAGVVTALSPFLFHELTGGLGYVGGRHGWSGYVAAVVALAVPVMLLPGTVLGAVLPFLLRALQSDARAPGETIGRLIAANTCGAILGALGTGFVLLPAFGAVQSLLLLAAAYGLLLAATAMAAPLRHSLPVAGLAACAAVVLAAFVPHDLQGVRLNEARGETLVELREGTAAHAAVIEHPRGLALRVNNYYTLGGTATLHPERNQAIIPLLSHPEPRSAFFLGMGTGLTAGAALRFPLERVTVCEILPEVIALARRHFHPWVDGLFDDPRVTIHAEDGRNCLSRSRDRYDVIVSDLFTPWKAGTGNLYTREHFRTVRDRLNPGGLFAQWIPLYQVSAQELGIIARTMLDVFPQVVMWRGDLFAERSIVALVGLAGDAALEPAAIVANARDVTRDPDLPARFVEELVLRYYAGNVTGSGLFDSYPPNTDDRPLIEYLAPRTHRAVVAGEARWMTGAERDDLFGRLSEAVPPQADPYLARLDPALHGYVRAGLLQSNYVRLRQAGQDAADGYRSEVERLSPLVGARRLSPAGYLLGNRQTPSED